MFAAGREPGLMGRLVAWARRQEMLKAGYKGVAFRLRRIARSLARDRDALVLDVPRQVFAERGRHVFCGYYDTSPFDGRDSRLLAMRFEGPNRSPAGNSAEVGYFDLNAEAPRFRALDETASWSWQLGSRLQWLDREQGLVIYNRGNVGQPGTTIRDVESGKIVSRIPDYFFCVEGAAGWALSIDFARLHLMRPGYGYPGPSEQAVRATAPGDDGIRKIDLDSGRSELIVSLEKAASFEPLETMRGAVHYFNHLQVNPVATRFSFMHIWVRDGKRFTRLLTCSPDGQDLFP